MSTMYLPSPRVVQETEWENARIRLKVVGHDNEVVQYRILKHKPLGKLMDVYEHRSDTSLQILRFHFKGNLIRENDTPISLNMKKNDTIKVTIEPIED